MLSLINDLKPIDLEAYQANREKQGASPASIDMEVKIAQTATTKDFYNDLHDGRALKAFKATKRKLKFGQNARDRILSFSEYLRLLQEAPVHLEPIIITAICTGMRMGEILELKWQYIKDGFIRLPYKSTKEKKAKTIPINHHLQTVLDNQPKAIHHNFVYTYRGNHFAEGGIKRSFKTAVINAKIPYGRKTENGITFHDIRRTVKTNMLRAGVNKIYRDLILGHSLKGMDTYYIKPDDDDLKQAMELYTAWFDEQLDATEHAEEKQPKVKMPSQSS